MADTAGSTHLLLQSPPPPMATKYELPAEVNDKRLRTLGMEVEMKTFKTNVANEGETCNGDLLIKIICVGDYTGGEGTKGVFIDDYCQVLPPVKSYRKPVVGVDFYLKLIEWRRIEAENPFLMRLHLFEIAEQERSSRMTKVYYKGSHGTIVFWGTRNPSSLEGAIKMEKRH